MNPRTWGRSALILMVLSMMLQSCAFRQIIYSKLDWVAMYQIDAYLDLTREQKAKYKPIMTEAVNWLKKEKVPGAVVAVGKLKDAAHEHHYDDAMNKGFVAEVNAIRKDFVNHYESQILDLLAGLSDDQLAYLAKKMKKSNEPLEDVLEAKDVGAAYDKTLKKQYKAVEEWYGDLSDAQKDAFYKAMHLETEQIKARLAGRAGMQDFILATLKTHDRTKIAAMVKTFADTGEVWTDPKYMEYRRSSEVKWDNYLKALHASLTEAQWKHLEGKLEDLQNDLRGMIGQG